jgi:hypothetical protein
MKHHGETPLNSEYILYKRKDRKVKGPIQEWVQVREGRV